MKKIYSLIIMTVCALTLQCEAQSKGSGGLPESGDPGTPIPGGIKKGSFFITTYYQYNQFQKLRMVSQTNKYSMMEGEASYKYTSEDIDEYNDFYKTDYTNSLMGLRIGYQAMKGLGVNAFVGVSHFDFRSWISDENTQSVSTHYPAFTFGAVIDYEKAIVKNLYAMGFGAVTFVTTSSVLTYNTSGQDVISSRLNSLTWDLNFGLSYKLAKFFPYAGVGFTQQFIHPVSTEQNETTDDDGNTVYETTTFDTHFRGDAFYGFAGLEYRITHYLSVYARSTFVNPVRATAGLKVSI